MFSIFDCDSGFWQVDMDSDSIPLTAFHTPSRGMYAWRKMPMGLTNSPATFQRVMDMALAGVIWQSCLVFVDDACIFSPTPQQHLLDLEAFLSRIVAAGLRLKMKKSRVFQVEVPFLANYFQNTGSDQTQQKWRRFSLCSVTLLRAKLISVRSLGQSVTIAASSPTLHTTPNPHSIDGEGPVAPRVGASAEGCL